MVPYDEIGWLPKWKFCSFSNRDGQRSVLSIYQLHEFEALLYCDLSQLEKRIPNSEKAIAKLLTDVAGSAPEDINEGATTAPSKRIIRQLPIYERIKVRIGAPAVATIRLHTLRMECPHFDDMAT